MNAIINSGASPAPWKKEIRNTNRNTLEYSIRDVKGNLIAFINELNRECDHNLSLMTVAPELLEELKNALCIIATDCYPTHGGFVDRATLLIAEAEKRF